jgi:hypothetical protein
MGKGLENPFYTASGGLPNGEVKIGGPALAGLSEELEDIECAHC